MPVRKIPKNHIVITGLVATDKSDEMTAFEGDLERDFMKILTFDSQRVLRYEEQPVTIRFIGSDGKEHSYTPDILIFYKDGSKPLLAEIKPRRYIRKHWKKLKPKFRAAYRYAKEKGWRFEIISEVEIRTSYRDNVVFLLGFRNLPENEADITLILDTLIKLRETTPQNLLLEITEDRIRQAYLIPSLWQLVATYRVGADLEEHLTMYSRLWSITR